MLIYLAFFLFSPTLFSSPHPVYKSPKSLFHSGHAELSTLESHETENAKVEWVLLRKDGEQGWSFKKSLLSPSAKKEAYSQKDAILYKKPNPVGKVLALLNQGTSLKVISINKEWVRVQFGKMTGFILKDQILLPMLLKENQAFTTKPLNIYSSPSQQSSLLSAWPAYQKVNVLSHHDVEWKKSRVNSLGTIWWQAPSSQKKKVIRKTQKKEKFDAIFDIASSPRSSKVKLISASGIFLQKDGKTKRLSFFKNNNHPLSIAENGTFFIGPYLSTNQGQSFQPYIDWPSMANVLKLKSLKSIKVQDIVIKDKVGQELSIEVQSSRGKNILYSRNQGKSWTLVQ